LPVNLTGDVAETELNNLPTQAEVEANADDRRAFLEYLYDFEDGHYLLTHLRNVPYGGTSQNRRVFVTGKYSPNDSIPRDPERAANVGNGNPAPSDRFSDGYSYIEANRSVVDSHKVTFAVSFQEFNGIQPDGFFFLYNHSLGEEGITFINPCVNTYRGETAYPLILSGPSSGTPPLARYGLVNVPVETIGYGSAIEVTQVRNSLSKVAVPGEEHTVFVTLEARVEDWEIGQSALVAVVPYTLVREGKEKPERKIPLEMITTPLPIARAHDPNYIVADRSAFIHGQSSQGNVYPNCVELTYKAHFQNIGRAPATRVDLEIPIDAKLQAGSFQLIDWSPKVPLRTQDTTCDTGTDPFLYYEVDCNNPGRIYFSFHHVEIQGTKDQGADPRAATTGWVKYKMKTLPISANAASFTNASTTALADITFFDALGELPSIKTNESIIDLRLGDFETYGAFIASDAGKMNQFYPNCGT
ncbi:MAG: hypothetical protein AAFR59_14455, partial [Bacteroidota bacterium]